MEIYDKIYFTTFDEKKKETVLIYETPELYSFPWSGTVSEIFVMFYSINKTHLYLGICAVPIIMMFSIKLVMKP